MSNNTNLTITNFIKKHSADNLPLRGQGKSILTKSNSLTGLPTAEQGKIPNLKEFIKYLDQTLKIFDQHIAEEDFENKDSDVYKLFTTLFNMYTDLDPKKNPPMPELSKHQSDNISDVESISNKYESDKDNVSDINSIIAQHIENKKKQKKNIPKWENNRPKIESEKMAQEIYKKSLLELYTPNKNDPIIITDNKKNTKNVIPNTKIAQNKKKFDNIYQIPIKEKFDDSTNSTDSSNSDESSDESSEGEDTDFDMYTDYNESVSNYKNNDSIVSKQKIIEKPTSRSRQLVKPHAKKQKNITTTSAETSTSVESYAKTDDIDKKINILKKMLNK